MTETILYFYLTAVAFLMSVMSYRNGQRLVAVLNLIAFVIFITVTWLSLVFQERSE